MVKILLAAAQDANNRDLPGVFCFTVKMREFESYLPASALFSTWGTIGYLPE